MYLLHQALSVPLNRFSPNESILVGFGFNLCPVNVFHVQADEAERLSKAKEEAAEIVGSATRRAAERSDEILRESSQQASAMVKKAERVIEQERIKAHKELKDEVADLSVMIASKIVERDVKPEDHERFIEDFIDKVG